MNRKVGTKHLVITMKWQMTHGKGLFVKVLNTPNSMYV